MVNINQETSLSMKLQMSLSPRLLETLKILNLPFCDFVERIEKASEENPFLEIEKPEVIFEYLNFLQNNRKVKKETDFTEYGGLKNISVGSPDLKTHLIGQLKLTDLKGGDYKIAEELIQSIDPNGYAKDYEKIEKELSEKFKVKKEKILEILKIIQTFEPDGVGARDLKECLLIQAREFSFDDPEIEELLEHVINFNLEDLGREEFQKIADARGVAQSDIVDIKNLIKNNFNPYPGSSYGDEPRKVVPSYSIEIRDKKIVVTNLEEKYGPRLAISKEYRKMLNDPKTDQETVKFLKEKHEKAKEMMENLAKRQEIGAEIMKLIIEKQEEFLTRGKRFFNPLQQNGIAEKLGVNPSTISRAVAGKYIQTERGIYPMKYFCPRDISGSTTEQIKDKISQIIRNEDKKNPLSDGAIVSILEKEGIKLSKRTIASYRALLEIKPYTERAANG